MTFDTYVEVEPGADIKHDVLPVDAKVEIQIGSAFDPGAGMLALSFSDRETLDRLVEVATKARAALMR